MVKYESEEVRRSVLEREGYRCFLCKKRGVQIHEIIPRSAGRRKFIYSEKNRVCLCPECHAKAHTRTERTKTLKMLIDKYKYSYDESEMILIRRYTDA